LENSSIFVIWVYVIQMWFQTVSGSSWTCLH
jgi:hypothetical protein